MAGQRVQISRAKFYQLHKSFGDQPITFNSVSELF